MNNLFRFLETSLVESSSKAIFKIKLRDLTFLNTRGSDVPAHQLTNLLVMYLKVIIFGKIIDTIYR